MKDNIRLTKYFWAAYIILFPFYLLPSGGGQLSDVFGVLLIFFSLKQIFNNINNIRFIKVLFLFLFYTFIVNLTWVILIQELSLLKSSVNYLYTFLLMNAVLIFFKSNNSRKFTFKIILFSLFLQLICYFLSTKTWGYRKVIFFNNPNQLALWGVTTLVMVNVLAKKIDVKRIELINLLITFFIMISASKIAIFCGIVFWGYWFVLKKKTLFDKIAVFILIIVSLYNVPKIMKLQLVDNVFQRIQTDDLSDDTLEGRGFDRLWNHKEFLLFGAGEGENKRFNSQFDGELHSTLMSVLFSYGVIGFLFYIAHIRFVFMEDVKKEDIMLMFLLFTFSLVHMTLRIPFFWIAIAIIYTKGKNINKRCVE